MRSVEVVVIRPSIKVSLQLFERLIDFHTECNGVEFVLYGSVETFADAVCLWTFRLDFRAVYVFISEIEFILEPQYSVPLPVKTRSKCKLYCLKKGMTLSLRMPATTRAFLRS